MEGLSKVTVSGGTVNGNIYGGSQRASSVGSTQVEITGGTLSGNVYGAGWGANTVVEGNTTVNVSSTYVNQIAGGGLDGAEVKGSTNVTLDGGRFSILGNGRRRRQFANFRRDKCDNKQCLRQLVKRRRICSQRSQRDDQRRHKSHDICERGLFL